MEKIKLLSLVVPAYKQEKTIARDIANLDRALSLLPLKHEIIVVIDGYVDKTNEILKEQTGRIKNLEILGLEKNCGKGYAVKYGILKAKGDVVGFIDAGMDIDPSSVGNLIESMKANGADIVIGSKFHSQSNIKYPLVRRILSWGYKNIVHLLFGLNVRDTQAGLKLFREEVARKVFPKVKVRTFAFDIEVLVIAKSMGFDKIYEAPIKVHLKKGSITNINFFIVALGMLIDTIKVFFRIKTNYYN